MSKSWWTANRPIETQPETAVIAAYYSFGFDIQLQHFVIQQMRGCRTAPLGVAITRSQVIWSPVPAGAL